jgi:hypothetical protein
MSLIVLIIVLFLLGGVGGWGFNTWHAGYGLPGGAGLIILVLLVLWLTGYFGRGRGGPAI